MKVSKFFYNFFLFINILLSFFDFYACDYQCHQRHFANSDSFVCVCNSTHCDQPEPFDADLLIGSDQAIIYLSDQKSYRLNKRTVEIKNDNYKNKTRKCGKQKMTANESDKNGNAKAPKIWIHIKVNSSKVYQKLHGFGGSFTDSVGFNIQKLSVATQKALLGTYFDKKAGIGYSLGRVPMGGTDFSLRAYSYDDNENDFGLKKFALAREDMEWKIPFISSAQKLMKSQKLQLIASPWSPPGWMKTNGNSVGNGTMKGEMGGRYYQTFAQYFIRFFEEYKKHNVTFWACSLLNEPYVGAKPGMYMNGIMQREWAKVLSAALKQSKFKKTVLLAHDDNRNLLIRSAIDIFANQSDSPIDGLSFHWYSFGDYETLSHVHSMFPSKFLIGGEASAGFTGPSKGVSLGNWDRAVQYGRDIIADLQNWATGWIDWNLCLDQNGGPNFVNNFIDAPVIVNEKEDAFYKQPTFYSLAHFSCFIPPQSERIDANFESPTLLQYFPAVSIDLPSPNPVDFVAFRTSPQGNRVMVLLSNKNETIGVKIHDGFRTFDVTMPPRAIATVIWGN